MNDTEIIALLSKPTVTYEQAAAILGVRPRQVRHLVQHRRLVAVGGRNHRKVTSASLAAYAGIIFAVMNGDERQRTAMSGNPVSGRAEGVRVASKS